VDVLGSVEVVVVFTLGSGKSLIIVVSVGCLSEVTDWGTHEHEGVRATRYKSALHF